MKLNRTLLSFSLISLLPVLSAAQSRVGEVDIFMGVQFSYRDIFFNNRVYDVLVNLTPGVKWYPGNHWEVSAQALVPVINQFGDRYSKVRLNVATVSKQFDFFGRWRMKVSGGWFGYERYGIDVKNMVVLTPWLAMTGQVGLTGYCSMAAGLEASSMERLSYLAGPEFYLRRWNTQMSVRGGRFVYKDYGVIAEAMRHFRHVTVGIYGSYSSVWKENAGFKVTVMLPPYKRRRRRVNFRPASNFKLTYSMEADTYSAYNYITDPEENQREGWFDHDLIPWGPDSAFVDFRYVTKTDSLKQTDR